MQVTNRHRLIPTSHPGFHSLNSFFNCHEVMVKSIKEQTEVATLLCVTSLCSAAPQAPAKHPYYSHQSAELEK